MKLAHLADLHVGFRQYNARAPGGGNQREVDVETAVNAALADVASQRPDLVVIAGDVFHSVLPAPRAVLFLYAALQRLRAALPEARVVVVSGDHDTPRSSETTSILALYRSLGINVVQQGIERVTVGDCVVTCVPQPWARTAALQPAPNAGINVLLLHGEARPFPGRQVEDAVLERGWDYVALGHWHVHQQVGPRAWYAGAVEYTSTDPWGELRAEVVQQVPGKGWLLVELPGGEPQFRPVATRPHYDLGPLECAGLSANAIDSAIAQAVTAQPLAGAVARLTCLGVTRETQHAVNHTSIRAWQAKALNLQLRFERPAAQASTAEGRAVRMMRLEQMVDEFLGRRELPADMDRAALRHLGGEYLESTKHDPQPE